MRSWFKLIWRGIWECLSLASPKWDDEETGVDVGGQGRQSWRQS